MLASVSFGVDIGVSIASIGPPDAAVVLKIVVCPMPTPDVAVLLQHDVCTMTTHSP